MKLRVLSEIQLKEPSTNMDRSNSTGVRAQGSVNDLLHKPQVASKKNKKQPSKNEPIT